MAWCVANQLGIGPASVDWVLDEETATDVKR